MMAVYRGQCISNWDLNGNGDDAGPNNLDATPENMEWGSGKFGQCGVFDGVDARLTLPNNALLKPISFTVMGWYNGEAASGTLIQNWVYSGGFLGWSCAFSGGYLRFLVAKGGGTTEGTHYRALTGTILLNDDADHFLAYTYNGSTNAMKLYVDAVPCGNATSLNLVYASTMRPAIGAREDNAGSPSQYMSGNASNITLLDYDATVNEIRRWFAWGRGLLI